MAKRSFIFVRVCKWRGFLLPNPCAYPYCCSYAVSTEINTFVWIQCIFWPIYHINFNIFFTSHVLTLRWKRHDISTESPPHSLQQAVILSAVPVLVVSFLTGCLFATCGLMGSKANSECCACCYCCCNACYCSLVTMGKAFVFYWQVWLGWFGKTTCWLW